MTIRLSDITTKTTQTVTGGNRGVFEGGHPYGAIQGNGTDSVDTFQTVTNISTDVSEIISIATPGDAVRWTDARVTATVLGSAASDGTYGCVHSGVANPTVAGLETPTISHMEWVSFATGARNQNFNSIATVGHAAGSDGSRFVHIGGTTSLSDFSVQDTTVRYFSVASPAVQSYVFGFSLDGAGGTEPVVSDGQRFRQLHVSATQDIPSYVTNSGTVFPNTRQFELLFSPVAPYMAVSATEFSSGTNWARNGSHQLGGAATDGSRIISHSFEVITTQLNLRIVYNHFDGRAPVQEFGTIAPGTEFHETNHYPTTTMTTDSSRVVIQYSRGSAEPFANGHLESVNISTPASAVRFGNPLAADRRRALGYSGG